MKVMVHAATALGTDITAYRISLMVSFCTNADTCTVCKINVNYYTLHILYRYKFQCTATDKETIYICIKIIVAYTTTILYIYGRRSYEVPVACTL
jgi:hypothetical protein